MYKKSLVMNTVHLMWRLFNLKMVEISYTVECINQFNETFLQLKLVSISFDDEVKALILLSSLLERWNGMVTAVSSSSDVKKLMLNDVWDQLERRYS